MRILIATHGYLAEGLKSALSIIVGKIDKIDTITAYVNEIDFREELNHYFSKDLNEELIVCTDIFGGSVNQSIVQKLKEKDFILITGVNLSLLLELLIAVNNDDVSIDLIRTITERSRQQTLLVNDILKMNTEDDFD